MTATPLLREIVLALLATELGQPGEPLPAGLSIPDLDPRRALALALASPHKDDHRLVQLRHSLGLSLVELLSAALCREVERDPLVGRIVAWAQAPIGGSRPTPGLLLRGFGRLEPELQVEDLVGGAALHTGLLTLSGAEIPLVERPLAMPLPMVLALAGRPARAPGTREADPDAARIALPRSILDESRRLARGLQDGRALVLRSGHRSDARACALAIVEALGRQPLFIDGPPPACLGPLLQVTDRLPIFALDLGPGERKPLPPIPGWTGPVLVVTGPEGAIEAPSAVGWTVPIPSPQERQDLWLEALPGGGPPEAALAGELARRHRHGIGRISELGRIAEHLAARDGRSIPGPDDIAQATWHGEGGDLGTLAQPIRVEVKDEALVLPASIRDDLHTLLSRCRRREGLVDGLGLSARTRRPAGVRALLIGPSGTGKTLAVGWLANRLGLPLFRVDLASVVSKYIGETEKNLSELMRRAESAEVVLFFDEADTLFGKRTEVNSSTDRFANSQTNYLLQRIEDYEGIVVLASNSRARFDSAFTRRLDIVIELPPPGPNERKALWEAHLGQQHGLRPEQLNGVAAHCDLAGGHVRNAVLAASARALDAGRPIGWEDVVHGVAQEYRKLGKPVPSALLR